MKKLLTAFVATAMLGSLLCMGASAVEPKVSYAGPIEAKGEGNKEWVDTTAYVPLDQKDEYSTALTAEYTVTFTQLGEWARLYVYLDAEGFNDWGGYMLAFEGGEAAWSNSGENLDGNCGLSLYAAGKPGWKFAAGKVIDLPETGVAYRVVLERVIGAEDTTVKVWYFKDGEDMPAEPLFTYTADNETYGGASSGIKFASWDRVEATITDLKVYNVPLADINAEEDPPESSDDGSNPNVPVTGVAAAVLPAAVLLGGAGIALACLRKKK